MAAAADEAAGEAAGGPLLADRLLALLEREIAAMERVAERQEPMSAPEHGRTAKAGKDAPAAGGSPEGRASENRAAEGRTPVVGEAAGAGIKARVEAIALMTRTLEKLLELKRLETLTLRGEEAADTAETQRLREEMMKRLRALDARRSGGRRLFGPDGVAEDAPAPARAPNAAAG